MCSRNQSLDVLRGIAILLVLGHHFVHYSLWAKVGWVGVDLFFVLSGFLISGLLFSEYRRHSEIKVGRFIIRRGLKIWPSYYVLMAVTAGFSLLVARARGVAFPKHEVLVSALFTRNFFGNDGFNYLAHSWSLAVEEHFYLLLPLLFVLLLRFGKRSDPFRSIAWIFLGVASVCFVLRYIAPQNGPYPWASYLRMDGLFAGVLIGYLYHFRRSWFDKLTGDHALGICALYLLPAFTFSAESEPMKTYGINLLMIGFSFLS